MFVFERVIISEKTWFGFLLEISDKVNSFSYMVLQFTPETVWKTL